MQRQARRSKKLKIVDLSPSRSFFRPGEPICLEVELANFSCERACLILEVSVTWLDEQICGEERKVDLRPEEHKTLLFEFPPQYKKFLGCGVDALLKDQGGTILDARSTAFDVLEDWTLAPRYGFLCDFSKTETDTEERIKTLKKFHINCVQFYDWMYRHHDLIPPEEEYVDVLGERLSNYTLCQSIGWSSRNIEIMCGRRLSTNTLRRKIEGVKRYGMAALAYGAIYGAEEEFLKEHPDWALYTNDGRVFSLEDLIFIMNISRDCGWHDHILTEFARALKEFDFDGIHLDQYGFPKSAYSHLRNTKELVDMPRAFGEFNADCRKQLSEIKPDVKLVFNAVNGWPLETVANSDQDVIYIEVWPPHETYRDLKELISRARVLAPYKQIILAAYMSVFNKAESNLLPAAERATLLTFSSIHANGAFQLFLGEKNCILTDGYYPAYVQLRLDFVRTLQHYWDFIVRYENFLFDPELKDISLYALGGIDDEFRILDYPYSSIARHNTIWAVLREMPGYKVLSLINLLNVADARWDSPKMEAVTPLRKIKLEALIQEGVKKILFTSPDFNSKPLSLDFQPFKGKKGEGVKFEVPTLDCWDLVIFELKRGS